MDMATSFPGERKKSLSLAPGDGKKRDPGNEVDGYGRLQEP